MPPSKRRTKKKATRRSNLQGSVTPFRGKFRWRLPVGKTPDGKVIYGAQGMADTRQDAEDALTQARADLLRGTLASPDAVTVEEYAERWLKRQERVRRVSASTLSAYRYELGYATRFIGRMRVKDVRASHVNHLIHQLLDMEMGKGRGRAGKPMSHRTVMKVLTHLRGLFKDAITEQIIYVSPLDGVKAPRAPEATDEEDVTKVFDFPELARFVEIGSALHAAGLCRLWPALRTCASVGLRRGEAAALRWSDVNFERGVLMIRQNRTAAKGGGKNGAPKTRASRRDVPLPESLAAFLRAQRERLVAEARALGRTWSEDSPVFATETGAYPHPDNLNRSMSAVLEWSDPASVERRVAASCKHVPEGAREHLRLVVRSGARLPELSPHALRHTYATLALRSRVPVEVVSKTLGHAKVSITLDTYRHVLESEARAEALDLFAPPKAFPAGKADRAAN